MSNLNKLAEYKIFLMESFVSTADYPAPSYLPFGELEDDIAAVIASRKPSAIIPIDDKSNLLVELIKIAKQKDCFAKIDDDQLYVSKDKNTLNKLIDICNSTSHTIEDRINRCTTIGKLLGYCDEAIYDFVENHIKNKLNYEERRQKRELAKLRK